jgi:GxxExxY protein
MTENEIAKEIVDVAYKIHTKLGPGLLESVYEKIMLYELRKRGLKAENQVWVPLIWEEVQEEQAFRADLMVEDKVVVELKAVEETKRVYKRTLKTYLSLADKRLGLLINFGEEYIKNGISRVVNNLQE